MTKFSSQTFTAQITIGLFVQYQTENIISYDSVKEALGFIQRKIHEERKLSLSAKLSKCDIFFLGQDEPHITIEFIQYPKFHMDVTALKEAVEEIAAYLMEKLNQNRVVVVFTDETIMLEKSAAIDPAIRL